MSGIPYRPALRSAAVSGGLPSRTSNRVTISDPWLFGQRADRIAPYKVIRQAGAARSVRGALCEQMRDFDTLRAPTWLWLTGCAMPHPCPLGLSAVRLFENSASRNRNRGDAPPNHWRRRQLAHGRDSGRLAARRRQSNGRRLSAPTRGTSVPCPAPRGAADEGDAASARGDLANSRRIQSGRLFWRPARISLA